MPGKASVVFNADTGQYVAAVQGMDAATAKAAQTVADAKNKILEAYKAQEAELKKLGASSDDFATAGKNASNALTSITEKNAEKQIEALDRVFAKQKSLKAEMAALGSVSQAPAAGHGFSDRMAVSAVVREGEGTTSIRAIENVLTMFPAATAAAQVFATAIGVGGVLGIVAELGEKGYQAYEQLRDATKDATQAAEELNEKERVSIDTKELENQKLQDQIDKLSGHPNNGLATALLEAKKNADDLLNSLRAAFRQEDELFKQQDRGFAEKALHTLFNVGPEGTEDQRHQLKDGENDLISTVAGYRQNLDANLSVAKTDSDRKAATKQYNDAVRKATDDRIAKLKQSDQDLAKAEDESRARHALAMGLGKDAGGIDDRIVDNSLQRRNVQTNIQALQNFSKSQTLDESMYDKQQQLGTLKQDKENNHAADEAARKAAEAARKAAEKQRQDWEAQIAGMQQSNPAFNAADTNLFYRSLDPKEILPGNKDEVQKKIGQSGVEAYRQGQQEMKQAQEEADRAQREQWNDQLEALKAAGSMSAEAEATYWELSMLQAEQGSQNYLDAQRRFNAAIVRVREERQRAEEASKRAGLQGANDQARVAEATVALEQQAGQISKYDAAVQLANIHTQQYAAQIAALKEELAKQQNLDVESRRSTPSADTINAQAAVDKAIADRQIQIQGDAAKAYVETWQGALQDVSALTIQNATDTAAQVKQLYSQAIGGLNEQAATALTGGKTDWSGYARGLGKTVATDGLQRAEAPLMQALGLGKPDGTSSNPIYVRMADGSLGLNPANGLVGSFASMFNQGSGAVNVGEGATELLGGLSSLIPKAAATTTTSTGSDASDAGSGIGGIFSTFADAVSAGGFALGGDVGPAPETRSLTVGELGPERLELGPGTSAHITPNKDMGSAGGNAYYSVTVANGVTPEQFDMKLNSALQQIHPAVVRSSVAAVKDEQRRMPSMARS